MGLSPVRFFVFENKSERRRLVHLTNALQEVFIVAKIGSHLCVGREEIRAKHTFTENAVVRKV